MSLKRNFSWMMAGSLIYALCQWLVLIAIAKFGTPEVLGEFAFALAITSPVVIFFNLNMRAFQATDANNEYSFDEYLAARMVQIGMALLTIFVIVYFSSYSSSIISIIAGVSFYKGIESMSDIYYGRHQRREHMQRIGRSLMIRGAVFAAAIFASMRMTNDVKLGVLFTVIGWFLVLLLHDKRGVEVTLSVRGRDLVATIWHLSKRCLPLGIVTFLVSLNANIPTYVIKNYLDTGQLGVFSALLYFAIVGLFISGALAQTVAPRLALYYSRSELHKFKFMQIKLLGVGAVMGILGLLLVVFLGEYVLESFYGAAYAAHVDVFFWVMLSAGVGYAAIFLGTGLTVARRFREMFFLNVCTVIVTAGLSFLLIPKYGLVGAAWALAGSATLKFIVNLMITYSIVYSHAGGRA